MLSITLDYLIPRGTSHQTCGSLESRMNFFADHQFSFAPGTSAATHQLHHPQRNYLICFDRQQNKGLTIPSPLLN
jgi:hypothetical protein